MRRQEWWKPILPAWMISDFWELTEGSKKINGKGWIVLLVCAKLRSVTGGDSRIKLIWQEIEMHTYQLQSDRHYGWITGITSEGLLLIATDFVFLYFSEDGSLLRFENKERENWEEIAKDLMAFESTICIQEFEIEGLAVGLRQMPKSYQRFVDDPEAFEAEERSRYQDEVSEWISDRLYDFDIGDNYWMNPDGTVHSS